MKIKFIFAWYDLWIGVFIDKAKRKIYIFPIPMFGIVIELKAIRRCTKCGSHKLKEGYYTSGWNNLCQQASGDKGVFCKRCGKIEFDETLVQRKAKAPAWIDVNI